tara:strand:+ start:1884 stop:2450 length:567 start_codon:yes stop_codon:yes gene_type:complete
MENTEAIVEIKNFIQPLFIEKLISFIDHKAINNLNVRDDKNDKGRLATQVRNVKGYQLSTHSTPTDIFYWNYIKKEITRLYPYYKIKFPLMESKKINQIDLLKYNSGGKYEIHTDAFTDAFRSLSVIINLNDDYEGGDLVFTDQQHKEVKRLKLEKGSIVFFPSNFLYPHGIEPIKKGTRYSVVAWLQ